MTAEQDLHHERWRKLIGGFTTDEIASFFGLPHDAAAHAVHALSSAGALLELPDGRWRFVPSTTPIATSLSSPAYVVDGLLAFLAAARVPRTSP